VLEGAGEQVVVSIPCRCLFLSGAVIDFSEELIDRATLLFIRESSNASSFPVDVAFLSLCNQIHITHTSIFLHEVMDWGHAPCIRLACPTPGGIQHIRITAKDAPPMKIRQHSTSNGSKAMMRGAAAVAG